MSFCCTHAQKNDEKRCKREKERKKKQNRFMLEKNEYVIMQIKYTYALIVVVHTILHRNNTYFTLYTH